MTPQHRQYADENDIESVFGQSLENLPGLRVEVDNEDVVLEPEENPSSNLVQNLSEALFDIVEVEACYWEPPRLKAPEKGKPVSDSLARLINMSCTSQCDTETLLSKYKIPQICLRLFWFKIRPFLFTNVLKPVYAWFRQQNIRCSYYIDDSLNMDQDRAVCQGNTSFMVKFLDSFGFTISFTQSSLILAQRIVFFGFVIDSVEFKVYLTEEKIQKILTKAKALLKKGVVIVRALASFIWLIINAFYAVFEAPLHYRGLERNKLAVLGVENNFDNGVILSKKWKGDQTKSS